MADGTGAVAVTGVQHLGARDSEIPGANGRRHVRARRGGPVVPESRAASAAARQSGVRRTRGRPSPALAGTCGWGTLLRPLTGRVPARRTPSEAVAGGFAGTPAEQDPGSPATRCTAAGAALPTWAATPASLAAPPSDDTGSVRAAKAVSRGWISGPVGRRTTHSSPKLACSRLWPYWSAQTTRGTDAHFGPPAMRTVLSVHQQVPQRLEQRSHDRSWPDGPLDRGQATPQSESLVRARGQVHLRTPVPAPSGSLPPLYVGSKLLSLLDKASVVT